MISIVTVAYNADDFADLLLDSVTRFTSEPYEVIFIDNGHERTRVHEKYDNVRYYRGVEDRTHGNGLNLGVAFARGNCVLILDNDCHLLCEGWEKDFLDSLRGAQCVTVQGPPEKPIRPACVFMTREKALAMDWRATPGYQGHRVTPDGYDVGIAAYHEMERLGFFLRYMTSNRQENRPNRYNTYNGEEYGLDRPLVYHHWHGCHLPYRQKDYPQVDLVGDKNRLFRSIPWRKRPVTLI